MVRCEVKYQKLLPTACKWDAVPVRLAPRSKSRHLISSRLGFPLGGLPSRDTMVAYQPFCMLTIHLLLMHYVYFRLQNDTKGCIGG